MNQYELGDALAVPFYMEIADKIKQYEQNVISGYEMDDTQKLGFLTTFRRVLNTLLFVSIVKGITVGIQDPNLNEDAAAQIMISHLMADIQKKIKGLYPNLDFVIVVKAKDPI